MIDCARHFMPIDLLRRQVRALSALESMCMYMCMYVCVMCVCVCVCVCTYRYSCMNARGQVEAISAFKMNVLHLHLTDRLPCLWAQDHRAHMGIIQI